MLPIKDFEQLYFITEDGKVWSVKSNRFLTNQIGKNGYLYIDLNKNGTRTRKYIHRLVAEAFLPNPNNLPQVNHIDENKNNNNVNNLEWISIKDNVNYGTRTERAEQRKKEVNANMKQIAMCNKQTHEIIKTYKSLTEASKENNIGVGNISSVLHGKRQTAGGYFWKFI